MEACEENLCDDHRLYDDDDETYTYEMETAGMKKEFERLKEFGLYSVLSKDLRDPGGRFITTTWVKTAKIVDGVKACRARLVCRDFKWRDPHAVGLFALATGASTQSLVDFTAVKRNWPHL